MSIGFHIVEQERQEAVERAMRRFRANQSVREQRPATGLGRGARRLSKEEAIALIAKKHPRSALRLLQEHFGGRTKRSN